MDIFQVIQPSQLLAPYVKQYWYLDIEEAKQSFQRLVPFACIGIAFHLGECTYSLSSNDYIPKSHIWGQTTTYTELMYTGNIRFIAIILQPAGANAILSIPPKEIQEQIISIDSSIDSKLLELYYNLNDLPDLRTSIRLIENFLIKQIYNKKDINQERINTVIDSIAKGENDLGTLAETACLGKKQFRRLFSETLGINPKDYIRVIRFQKAMHLLQIKPYSNLTQIAEECNYYDKSHMLKDMKSLSGLSPKEFLSVCDPYYSEYHALFRSAFIDNPKYI